MRNTECAVDNCCVFQQSLVVILEGVVPRCKGRKGKRRTRSGRLWCRRHCHCGGRRRHGVTEAARKPVCGKRGLGDVVHFGGAGGVGRREWATRCARQSLSCCEGNSGLQREYERVRRGLSAATIAARDSRWPPPVPGRETGPARLSGPEFARQAQHGGRGRLKEGRPQPPGVRQHLPRRPRPCRR